MVAYHFAHVVTIAATRESISQNTALFEGIFISFYLRFTLIYFTYFTIACEAETECSKKQPPWRSLIYYNAENVLRALLLGAWPADTILRFPRKGAVFITAARKIRC